MNDLSQRLAGLSPKGRKILSQALQRRGAEFSSFPLSFAQQRLWFLDQWQPGSPVYNLSAAVHLSGGVDAVALERSLREIADRHQVLRATFVDVAGQPLQVVHQTVRLTLPLVDLAALPPGEREAHLRQLAAAEARQPFDLARGPLLRASLLRLTATEHVLLLTMHHIVSDGWSIGILVGEIAALYAAFAAGRPSPLAELPIQYTDFTLWQQQWLQGEVLATQLAYWQRRLDGAPAVLQLPTDRPRPAAQTFRGARQSLALSQPLTDALEALSRQQGVTLFMVLLAAFETLLYRYTGQEDVVVGAPIANRNRAEVEGLIGFFVNTLVLRADLSGDVSFRELLERARQTALEAYAHQDLPFEKLVEELQPERNLNRNPLFQVVIVLQNVPMPALALPGLTLRLLEADTETAKFDLILDLKEGPSGLTGCLEYSTDLFDAATIARLAAHFQTLLAGVVADPGRRLSALPLLTAVEQQQILLEWNDARAEYPQTHCLHQLFKAQVARAPDAVAVVLDEQHLTYEALNRRANQLAHYLQKLGVGPETVVGLCLDRSVEMITGLWGILKAGGVYLPLDPAYPTERLAFMLTDSQAPLLLTQERLVERLAERAARVVCLDADRARIAQESGEDPGCDATPGNLAYVIYTSGSVGRPKGVAIQHGSLAGYVDTARVEFALQADDRVLQFASISFDTAAEEIYPCLTCGATLVLRAEAMLGPAATFLRACQEMAVSVLDLPTAFWHELVRGFEAKDVAFPLAVRLVIVGGERASPERWAGWQAQVSQKVRLVNTYGPTEATIVATLADLTTRPADEEREVTIGYPVPDVQTYILDGRLQPAPIGVPGELHVGGVSLARGYLTRPAMTAEKFIPDPFGRQAEGRLYRTGDLARWLPDGSLEFLGRIDHQVKVRGFRIELGEVEAALRAHEAVQEAVVLAREDRPEAAALVAYVVPGREAALVSGDLRRFLSQTLPDYMLPSVFVLLDALPLLPNGKVDRRALSAPEPARPEPGETVMLPRTPVEEMVAGIWAEVLGLERVGIHDDFFALGGHSLLATQVVSRLRSAFQVELPLRRLFESPTVAGLAHSVEAARQAEQGLSAPPILPVPRDGDLPLSFAQQRLWFLAQFAPGVPFYNMFAAARLAGALGVAALARSLEAIARRHETLRTTFEAVDGRPVQVIAPSLALTLPMADLSALGDAGQEAEVRRLALAAAQRPFDLARGPLLRASLLRLTATEHVLLLTMHHIVSDGWSIGILVGEIAALYAAFAAGRPSPLAELPIQYTDFALWQRQWLQGEVLATQLAYWQRRLDGAPAVLQLPTDRPRPVVQTFRGARQSLALSQPLTEALEALSRQQGVTLFMVLLAAFETLLSRYTGQEDIVVGAPIANRNRAEVEGLIGFFVNTLVLRADLSGDVSFRELLERARQTALEAYAHQDLPFEKLVEELQPARDPSHSPLFQVDLALQNAPRPALTLPGLSLSLMEVDVGTARFDLEISLHETSAGLSGYVEYATDLFDAATIARLVVHFQTLLAGVVAGPGQRLSTLPLLTETERHQLLAAQNDTQTDYAAEACVHELFETQAARTPDAVSLVFEERHLTYQQLNRRANQLAHYLQAVGVGPEVTVGILVERSPEMVLGILGTLKAGGAYVPLDPTCPQERLAFVLADIQARVILTQERLVERLPARAASVVCLDADQPAIAQASEQNPAGGATPGNLAYVIYTSGSTGRPKGVMVLHQGIVNYLTWCAAAYAVAEGRGAPLHSAIEFDLTVTGLFAPLLVGQSVVLLAEDRGGEALGEALRSRSDWSLVKVTPAHLEVLGQQLPAQEVSGQTRALVIGGEALRGESLSFWRSHAPGIRLINEYGPTETVVGCCVYEVPAGAATSGGVPIGRPIANTRLYLLDRYLQPSPVGAPGELYVGGDGVARGYLNRPDLTAERFVPHPLGDEPGARLYKTGDLARRLPDGNLVFVGRTDYQVKVRGFRVELGEIEAVLSQHQAVRETVVVAREDAPGDPSSTLEMGKRLVAYVVPKTPSSGPEGQSPAADWHAEQVSQWQMVFDELYGQPPPHPDPTFNVAGWNSSYTGLPIPEEEMREWVDGTVERILSLRPSRVLEIGCGTALLLFRIAPHCTQYCGTDFSSAALQYLRQQLATLARELPNVTFLQREADNLAGIAPGAFDLVILNSVVQYFPGIDYLLRILEGAVKVVEPGGSIFVGDVRSLPLLEAFHLSVELHKAPPLLSKTQLQQRVQRQMIQEEELVIDPAFFFALKQHLPQIGRVQIQLKQGWRHNEMTRFRYDVILHVGSEVDAAVGLEWLDWQAEQLTLPDVHRLLAETEPEILGLSRVPNARLSMAVEALELLADDRGPQTAGDLRAALQERVPTGVDPQDLWALSDELPYLVDVSCARAGADGCYDVVFRRRTAAARGAFGDAAPAGDGKVDRPRPWSHYANNPLQGRFARRSAPQLRRFLEARLPDYMLPAAFVLLEALPLTPNGKVDRRALPAPESVRPDLAVAFVAPRTPLEETLAETWAEVLGLERVGIYDNFFELGGHSLLATQVVSRIRRIFQIEMPLRRLFETPTVAGLAASVEATRQAERGSPSPPILPASRDGDLPLSFAQQRLWFLDQFMPGVPVYNTLAAVRLEGALDVAALGQSLDEIVRRHEVLRTVFPAVNGQPVQAIQQAMKLALAVVDLAGLAEVEREAHVRQLALEAAQRPFDLRRGPLLRASLLRLDATEHVLLLTMHHIVSDGWSIGVLVREATALYAAFAAGRPSPLAELPVQYADFALWQRQWLQGESLAAQLAYWRRRLDGAPTAIELPTDRPRPAVQTFRGACQSLALSRRLTEALEALSRREDVTLFMLLLAAFETLLYRYTGQEDIVLGTPIANRNRAEIEGLIGFLVNMLVLRTDLAGDPAFRELLRRVREVTLGAYAHQDLPFEKLVEELQPERDLSRTPLFQVVFVFQNAPAPALEAPGLTLRPLYVESGLARFDLTLFMMGTERGLVGTLEYNTDLFDAATIAQMLSHFRALLEEVAAHPERRLLDISLLGEGQKDHAEPAFDFQNKYREDQFAF